MVELAGDLGLVDEAQEVVGGIRVEHHLHGDGAADGGFLGVEDGTHAALRDDSADVVFFLPQELLRQHALHDLGGRGERHVGGGLGLQPVQLDGGGADLDFLVGPQPRVPGDGLAVHERAVAAAEVFDEGVVEIERELRVPAGDEVGVHADVAVGVAAEDVNAGRKDVAAVFGAGDCDEDFGLGSGHAERGSRREWISKGEGVGQSFGHVKRPASILPGRVALGA